MKNQPRILLTDQSHACLSDELRREGFTVEYFPDCNNYDIEECIHDYMGIIVRSRIFIDKNIIDKAVNLKFIARLGSGMDNIDVKYAEGKGITCINSPEGNRDAVGEHTLGLLLCLTNKICSSNNQIKNGIWLREDNRGIEIKGRTIGIIGYGNMGSSFARKLKGLEAIVIAYDKYKFNYSDEFVKEVKIEEVFEQADIVSFHIPLNEETKYLINSEYISKFKKNIIILNTSRGKILYTKDLAEELKKGKVLGAGLDVHEFEDSIFEFNENKHIPAEYLFLLNSERVVLTPHIAGWTYESLQKLSMVVVEKIKKLGLSGI